MQNTNTNQYVKYIGWVASVLTVFVIALSFRPFVGGEKRELYQQSFQRAESLAYQLLQIHTEYQKNISNPNRGPASEASSVDWSQWRAEGEIGRDPWGDPYSYRLIRSDSGSLQMIQVWSKNNPEKVLLQVK